MKNSRFFFYFLFLLLLISCNQKSVRTLTVIIDESINKEAQWVYWMSLYDNEFNITDSCFIEKGQTEFVLVDRIMNDSVSMTELTFSEITIPWNRSMLTVDSKDRNIKVNNLTSEGFYENGSTVEGAFAEEELRKIDLKMRKGNRRLSELTEDLQVADYDDSIAVPKIVKERDSLKQYLAQTYLISNLDSVKYMASIEGLLSRLSFSRSNGGISKITFDSVLQIISERYPKNIQIQGFRRNYILGETTPLASERSKYWHKRRDEIRDYTYFKDKNKTTDGITIPGEKERRAPGMYAVKPDTNNVAVYTIGTKVQNLKLKDPKDNYISVSDLKTNYILIDFWAIWCVPCVEEIPNILNVHNKYKDKLSVYAISLDNTRQEWIEGIEKYKCRQFTHVYAGTWANEDATLLTKSFGINSIPANFLLDKDKRIIAKNIRGKELETKLSQLLKQ
ncbi:TlpA disulfide reductase family protein [Dysgonomonas sp. ZJ709]|uniref:TlpA family protein disulfide reductase n=1 Tax=Dysgonomonas sp. ZJ709 TaxID=2709797 RepID=UPI0013ED703E|nr:TlpA disulfide reductase family protein [Dysgonomonas sp. ZJ709]